MSTTEPLPPLEQPEAQAFWRTTDWWSRTRRTSLLLWASVSLTFLATLIAARSLGPAGYGQVALALAAVGFLATMLDLSLEDAVVHYGARYLSAGDTSGLRLLLRRSFKLDLGVGIAVAGLLLVASHPLAEFVSRGRLQPILLQLAALEVLVTTTNGTTGAVLLLSGRAHWRAGAMVLTGGLRAGFVLIAGGIGGPPAVLLAYMAASFVGAVVQALLAWMGAWRTWSRATLDMSVAVPMRRVAVFSLNSSATTTVIAARVAILSIILGRGAGPVEVGMFSVAMFPVTLAGVFSAPIRMTMFPEQARLAAEGRAQVLWHGLRLYTTTTIVLGVSGALAGWFILPRLLPLLYGDKFEAATLPARIMLVAAVATLAVAWSKFLPAAIGRPFIRTVVSTIELVGMAILMLLLSEQGALGAAITISSVSVPVAVGWWFLARRLVKGLDTARL
jgi:O-antigen/teichoic acid export membrane protein